VTPATIVTAAVVLCIAPCVIVFFVAAVLGPIMMASIDAERERQADDFGIIERRS